MMTATMLIGYDVECREPEVTRLFLRRASELHDALGIPATFFIVGQTLEQSVDAFRALRDHPWLDFQQHTYSHMLLKTVCRENEEGITIFRGGTLDQIREEVTRTSTLLKDKLGVDCVGLTGPYGYYRGLMDRPDILEILWEAGIRFTRTAARNEHDWQPLSFNWQPFWYAPQGYPDMFEFPVAGWQDCILREQVGWANLNGYLERVRQDVDHIVANDLVWSYVQHDWSSVREDPEMRMTRDLLRYARGQGVEFAFYRSYYDKMARARDGGDGS